MNAQQRHAAVRACMMEVIADMETTPAELRADMNWQEEKDFMQEEVLRRKQEDHREKSRLAAAKRRASMNPDQLEELKAKQRVRSRERYAKIKSEIIRAEGINYKQGEKRFDMPEHLRNKKYKDYNAEELAEYKRLLRSRRAEGGMCSCGQRPPKPGRKMCQECVTAAGLRTKARRAKLKAEQAEK